MPKKKTTKKENIGLEEELASIYNHFIDAAITGLQKFFSPN